MGIWGLIFQTFSNFFILVVCVLVCLRSRAGPVPGAASGVFKPCFWRKTGRKWTYLVPHDASPKAPRRPDVAHMMPGNCLHDAVVMALWCWNDAVQKILILICCSPFFTDSKSPSLAWWSTIPGELWSKYFWNFGIYDVIGKEWFNIKCMC